MKQAVTNIMNVERDWTGTVRELGVSLAENAARHDDEGSFVADNYTLLKEAKLFSAAIPQELGGGGASLAELCDIVRELGRYCGSTALSFAMHSHPVAVNVFKYLRGDDQAEATLRKIATNELVISGTGANDWLFSNGEAVPVEGGYRVNAHKRFCSGGPGADVFVTSAILESGNGPEVLHFAIPMRAEGVEVQDNWNTLGMRGTGSNDILMRDVFVPKEAIVARRPSGEWHPMWDVIVPVALPIIVGCYVGLAEAAVEQATRSIKGSARGAQAVGEMRNALTVAELAYRDMVAKVDGYDFSPSLDLTADILTRKTIAADSVKRTVELAAETVGGGGFFRGHPIERIVRDIRAFHFHPMPERKQTEFCGRIRLGLDPIG
jgi:alkylation response protein AidB-like acyl-CoA dehydrogenase